MRETIAAFIIAGVLAAVLALPGSAGLFGVAPAAPDTDVWNTLWIFHVVADRFAGDGPPLSANPILGFPGTTNLWPHIGSIFVPLLLSPITHFSGPTVALNLAGLAAIFLSVFVAFRFFLTICGDGAPALAAAALFGAGAFGVEEIHFGNPELAAIFVVPLAALSMVRLLDDPSTGRAYGAGAALGLATAVNPYHGVTAHAFAVLAVAYKYFEKPASVEIEPVEIEPVEIEPVAEPEPSSEDEFVESTEDATVAELLAGPDDDLDDLDELNFGGGDDILARGDRAMERMHPDDKLALRLGWRAVSIGLGISAMILLPTLVGALFSPGYGSATKAGADAATASWDLLEPIFFARAYPATLSLPLLVIALAGLYKAPKGYRFWMLAALAFYLLALGPEVRAWGRATGVPGPMALLDAIPGGDRLRFAYRFGVGFHLTIGAAAAITLRRLLEYAERLNLPDLVFGRALVLLAAVLCLASLPTIPYPVRTAPVDYVLTDRPEKGAVMELPATDDFYLNSRRLFGHRIHHRPFLGGRPMPDLPQTYSPTLASPLFDALMAAGGPEGTPVLSDRQIESGRLKMRREHVAFVAVHRKWPGAEAAAQLAERAFGEPVFDDDKTALYFVGGGL
ncbi:MAG: hypothetical protein H6684_13880 [Deltaproteobacteria bacterium]|nr:hypothetical protein [Deltaproteobacteria bacterium]MCB9478652.1 hypothetical protein [Deltaproteobacteria bacterium]MCB9489817.1 hypothetical protein [Deltaproteobacteria bacterium]